jgi:ABC-type transporter Mla subunit MlaD
MADDINKTKKEVEALIKKLTSQADVSYYQSLFDSLNKNQGNIEQFQRLMSQVKDDIDETRGNLNYVSQSFKSIVEELKGAKGQLNSQISSLNKISNIARQALEVRRGENVLSGKQLENLQLRNKREIDNLTRLKESGSIQGKALQNLKDQIKAAKEVDDAFEEIKKTEEEVNKELGFGPKLLGGLDKAMQKLGLPNLGFDDALKKNKAMAQEDKAYGQLFNSNKA